MSPDGSCNGEQVENKRFVLKLGQFELGDLVSSYGCETGRKYMPGIGEVIAIRPADERPYTCEHNEKLYYFKEKEISIHDCC